MADIQEFSAKRRKSDGTYSFKFSFTDGGKGDGRGFTFVEMLDHVRMCAGVAARGTICPICDGPMTNGWCFAERQPSHAACDPCEGTGFVLAGHAVVQIIESEDSE